MITKNTVFILGAGASKPYGFPSGQELVYKICDELGNSNLSSGKILYDDSPFANDVINAASCTPEEAKEFSDALKHSGRTSIDAFLEHRPEFSTIGKMAIAKALIACERKATFFRKDIPDWYKYFFNQLNTTFDDFDKNKVSILTFNYDRSFEHFLYTSLKNAYGKTDEEVSEKMRNFKIIHLYGQLGKYFPWEEQYRSYNEEIGPDCAELIMAGNGIKIISDSVAKDPEFDAAHNLIATADYVCFLGFGYNPINLERLKLKFFGKRVKYFLGSSFGFSHAEVGRIQSLIHNNFSLNLQTEAPPYNDCLNFLRNSHLLMKIYS